MGQPNGALIIPGLSLNVICNPIRWNSEKTTGTPRLERVLRRSLEATIFGSFTSSSPEYVSRLIGMFPVSTDRTVQVPTVVLYSLRMLAVSSIFSLNHSRVSQEEVRHIRTQELSLGPKLRTLFRISRISTPSSQMGITLVQDLFGITSCRPFC